MKLIKQDTTTRRAEAFSRDTALRAVAFHLAVRTRIALRAAVFPLAVRASIALRAFVFHLAVRTAVALCAVVFPLAVRTAVALCAVAFQLAMRTRVALHANGFMPPSVRAPLVRRHTAQALVSCSIAPDPCRRGSRSLPR